MKKTAVEFLAESLLYLYNEYDMGFIDKNEYQARRKVFIEQAKAMEKEQMEDMFETGHICGMDDCHKMNNGEIFTSVTFEQYYNETFKEL